MLEIVRYNDVVKTAMITAWTMTFAQHDRRESSETECGKTAAIGPAAVLVFQWLISTSALVLARLHNPFLRWSSPVLHETKTRQFMPVTAANRLVS
jgi:hypothetical protein